ncbi:MAG: hypothetical protein M1823_006647 [Watsoniomyces obsoletus]|nr:MAG: hypothetical protein M1823_006647 [Watsoniomyces obsoletus]
MFASTIDMAARSLEFCHEVGPASSSLTERLFVTIPQKHETGFIKRRIERHGAKVFVYDAPDVSNGKICAHMVSRAYSLRKQAERVTREMEESFSPTLGIVVALEVEYRAAQAILKDPGRPIRKRDANGFREYLPGYIDAYGGGRHKVVLIMVGMGNNKATAQAMRLLQDFKSVQELIMVGIAGGVPGLKAGQKDVRLGDVVVTDETFRTQHLTSVFDQLVELCERNRDIGFGDAFSPAPKGLGLRLILSKNAVRYDFFAHDMFEEVFQLLIVVLRVGSASFDQAVKGMFAF